MEQNQIYNSQLKENVVNTALGILVNNKLVTREDFNGLSVNIGYIFTKEDGQIEALFRTAFTDKLFFFALQNGKLMLIEINDDIYSQTVAQMQKDHPCLLDDSLPETPIQKKRREANTKILEAKNIVTNDRLLTLWEDDEVELRDKETICRRAIASLLVIQVACDIGKNNYEESVPVIKPLLEKYGVTSCLNSKEQRIMDGTYEMQDAIDLDWAYEAYWSLCWCLGLVDDISDGSAICDCTKAIDFVLGSKTTEEFISRCNLRSKEEILDMLDLYYRYNWAVHEAKVNPDASLGDLNPSIVIERRRGLQWAVENIDDWYELDMRA